MNWKTTTLGWLILIGAVASAAIALLDGNPATNPDLASITSALAGVGLIAAKDK